MNKFVCLVFIPCFLFASSLFSQVTTQWSSRFNGAAGDTDIVTAMTIDHDHNTYVTGYSNGNGTGKDFATVKYSQSGEQLWIALYNNNEVNSDDIAKGVAVDASGNVYVTGSSFGNGTFDDYITIKYSPSGSQLWSSRYNGKGNDQDIPSAILVDGLGNIFVTGYSVGATTSEDYATIKYNSGGSQQWIATYNNKLMDDIDIATSMVLDGSGNIYVTGYSIGTGSQEDYATVKYNSAGVELWNKRYNGTGNGYDITTGLALDAAENVYVSGYSFGSSTAEDFATIKYNSGGDELWVARYNGPSNSFDITTSIAVDNLNNVYIAGYSYNNATSEDYTTIKYSSDGNEMWVASFDGSGDFDIAKSLKVDNNGGVYVTGSSFNSGTEEDYATIKYNSDGIQQWIETYDGKTNGSDIATSLVLDGSGNIYVAGYSNDGVDNLDYITLKYSQTVGVKQISGLIPNNFSLNQNYPNPFNPETIIKYQLPAGNFVSLKIYNLLGKEVASLVNEKQNVGSYSASWNAANYPSGTYFYKLEAGLSTVTKKMLLLK